MSGKGFARAAYVMFAVAVLAAVLKIGAPSADPLFLREVPAEPLAKRIVDRLIPEDPAGDLTLTPEPSIDPLGEPQGLEELQDPASLAEEALSILPPPADPSQEGISQEEEVVSEAEASQAGDAESEARGRPVERGQGEDLRALGAAASVGPARATSGARDAPVFYRPSLEPSVGGALREGASSEPVCGNLGSFPASSRAVFPLPEAYFNSYDDTWGAPRVQGGHEGTDLMSLTGTPQFAITDGTIVPVSGANANGWNTLGGYTVMLRADYDVGPVREGDLFYYAHLDRASTLPIGTRVRAGQQVGLVGDTGQGPEVSRGQFPPHLHLGWYDTSGARTDLPSGAMNPYPLLLWLEENGGAVRGGTDASYCEAPQGPAPTPSTGAPSWPVGGSPGQSPDLNTGEPTDARPSPVVEVTEHNQTGGNGPRQDRPQRPPRDRAAEEQPQPPDTTTDDAGTGNATDGAMDDSDAPLDDQKPAQEPAVPEAPEVTVPEVRIPEVDPPEVPQVEVPPVPSAAPGPSGDVPQVAPDADEEASGAAEEIVEDAGGATVGPPQPGATPPPGTGASGPKPGPAADQPNAGRPSPVPDGGSLRDRIQEQVNSLLDEVGIGPLSVEPPVPGATTAAEPEDKPGNEPEKAKPKKNKKDDRKRDEKEKDRPEKNAGRPSSDVQPGPRPQGAPNPEPPPPEGEEESSDGSAEPTDDPATEPAPATEPDASEDPATDDSTPATEPALADAEPSDTETPDNEPSESLEAPAAQQYETEGAGSSDAGE
jgi:collagen type III alpha